MQWLLSSILQVSAHFRKFFAYSTGSSSVVLMGDIQTTPMSDPTIIPGLQNKSVISVVVGDYHYGALTASGKLLTFGAYSGGALGLGDPADLPVGSPGGFQTEQQRLRALDIRIGSPPDVQEPIPVRFDHHRKKPKERFCIGATASGWHMGALVIDLEVRRPKVHTDFIDSSPLRPTKMTRTAILRWKQTELHLWTGVDTGIGSHQ